MHFPTLMEFLKKILFILHTAFIIKALTLINNLYQLFICC